MKKLILISAMFAGVAKGQTAGTCQVGVDTFDLRLDTKHTTATKVVRISTTIIINEKEVKRYLEYQYFDSKWNPIFGDVKVVYIIN